MKLREILHYAHQEKPLEQKFIPKVKIFETPSEVDAYAAAKILEQVQKKPNLILTLPTGNTAIDIYKELTAAHKRKEADFHAVTIINLDEYYPIAKEHPNSFASFTRSNFIDYVSVAKWDIPDGEASDPVLEAQRYKQVLQQSQPIDLALLGIGPGTTCHIAFNEKDSAIESSVRYVPLHPETREVNAKVFTDPEEIPAGAITQGIADILQAEHILLVAKGGSKAWGVKRTLHGPISSDAPASFLRLHPDVTFVFDKNAAVHL